MPICLLFVVQLLGRVWLFVTLWTAAREAPLSFTLSQSLLKFMFIGSVMLSNHPILCCSLLLHSIFPRIRVFSKESALPIRCPMYWKLTFTNSLPMHIQGWFPLGLAGLISLLSKGLSSIFSCTTIQKYQFFDSQFSSWSSSHICTRLLEKP